VHISDMGRGPDQPDGLVPVLSQKALQQKRDLPVPTRDHYPHAATLLIEITGRHPAGGAAPGPLRFAL
jgi:hypothetical protein